MTFLYKVFSSPKTFLGCILILGFFLRTYNLTTDPTGFFADEASIGYNAYTILHTGKDEYGIPFPVFFQSFGDYKHPLQIYSTVPLIAIFGLNEFAVRFTSVMYGIVGLVIFYFLGKNLHSNTFGLLCVGIAATMPWFIHYNRIGFELNTYLTATLLTIFLLYMTTKHKQYIIPFFISLGITFYTYQPAKLIVPLLFIGILIIYRSVFFAQKRKTILGILIFFIISLPLVMNILTPEGLARFSQVSIFSVKLSLQEIIIKSLSNYFVQLTPSYFFTTGEPTFITRHFIHGLNPLLICTAPFLFIGFFRLFFLLKQRFYQLLLFLIIIYPIGGALVSDGPFTSRDVIGIIPAVLLISLGITFCFLYIKNYAHTLFVPLIALSLIIFSLNLFMFIRFYFSYYPLYSSNFWGWQFGARDIVHYFVKHENQYDQLVMAPEFNAPEIFFKFYAPNDCQKCTVGTPDSSFNPQMKQLFAVTPNYLQSHSEYNFKVMKTILYPNHTIAFEIGEIVQ